MCAAKLAQSIIPVMVAGTEAFYSGVKRDHVAGHGLAGRIGIETAVDFETLTYKLREPAWIRPGAGCGDAQAGRMKLETAEGIDSGFA
jgi:hypothetical protein